MRLRLTGLAAVLLAAPASAAEVPMEVASRVDVYDDGWIRVVLPQARVAAEVGDVGVDAAWAADVVSGATPIVGADLVSSATRFDDVRQQVTVGARYRPRPEKDLGLRYTGSVESDHRSHAATVDGGLEVWKRMVSLKAGITVSRSESLLTFAGDRWEPSTGVELELTGGAILDERTRATLIVTAGAEACGEEIGCRANPWRYATVASGDESVQVHERNPDSLLRVASGVRLARSLGADVAVLGGYRYYRDSWRIDGHTADATLRLRALDDRLMLSGTGRLAQQGAADFYRDTYAAEALEVPAWRSADRELAGLGSALVTLRAEWSTYSWGPFVRLGLHARATRAWYRSESPAWDDRAAWILGGGLDGEL